MIARPLIDTLIARDRRVRETDFGNFDITPKLVPRAAASTSSCSLSSSSYMASSASKQWWLLLHGEKVCWLSSAIRFSASPLGPLRYGQCRSAYLASSAAILKPRKLTMHSSSSHSSRRSFFSSRGSIHCLLATTPRSIVSSPTPSSYAWVR